MIAKKHLEEIGQRMGNYTAKGLYENEDGSLNIKKALMKFQEYHLKGLKQLEKYLELENADEGYLVIYDKNEHKEYKGEEIKLEDQCH